MAKGDIKRIFSDHWDEFLGLHGHNVRNVVTKEVKKMLEYGLIENGYAAAVSLQNLKTTYFSVMFRLIRSVSNSAKIYL